MFGMDVKRRLWTFALGSGQIYRNFTDTTPPGPAWHDRNLFRHAEYPDPEVLAAIGLMTSPWFSTIFSTGVENFGGKPNPTGRVRGARYA
jgi:hypothetical protein